MEKTIVIATKNKDKFTIVTDILRDYGLTEFNFKMLDSFEGYKNKDETGSIEERSKQKVTEFLNYLNEKNLTIPDIIIGVDDGFKKETDSTTSPYSKEITRNILDGQYLSDGELIYDVRSYTFFIAKTGEIKTVNTEIPYNYVKNAKMTNFEETRYPLSYVLRYVEGKNVISEEDKTRARLYNKRYAQALEPIIEGIKEL